MTSGKDFEPTLSSWCKNSLPSNGHSKMARNTRQQNLPKSPIHASSFATGSTMTSGVAFAMGDFRG
jgi:hypothetical protein